MFYTQKTLYSTGTTTVGLNDGNFFEIVAKNKIYNSLGKEEILKGLFNNLSLFSTLEEKTGDLITKIINLLIK